MRATGGNDHDDRNRYMKPQSPAARLVAAEAQLRKSASAMKPRCPCSVCTYLRALDSFRTRAGRFVGKAPRRHF